MKWKTEIAMYLLFALAALPLAWATIDLFIYYATYPESLQDRDAYRDALVIFSILPLTAVALVLAVLFSFYLLIVGHRFTRAAIVGLVCAYIVSFIVRPGFPVNTIARLAWDASTTSLLVVVPMLLLAFRVWQRNKMPRASTSK